MRHKRQLPIPLSASEIRAKQHQAERLIKTRDRLAAELAACLADLRRGYRYGLIDCDDDGAGNVIRLDTREIVE